MTNFMRGFATELIKLGGATGVVRPASTATGTEPRVPRPTNMSSAGRGDMLGAIPTQRMESPAKAKQETWRPSPGYSARPSSDPVAETPAKKKGPAPAAKKNVEPAWETSQMRRERQATEAAHNRGRAGVGMPGNMSSSEGKAWAGGSRPDPSSQRPIPSTGYNKQAPAMQVKAPNQSFKGEGKELQQFNLMTAGPRQASTTMPKAPPPMQVKAPNQSFMGQGKELQQFNMTSTSTRPNKPQDPWA